MRYWVLSSAIWTAIVVSGCARSSTTAPVANDVAGHWIGDCAIESTHDSLNIEVAERDGAVSISGTHTMIWKVSLASRPPTYDIIDSTQQFSENGSFNGDTLSFSLDKFDVNPSVQMRFGGNLASQDTIKGALSSVNGNTYSLLSLSRQK